MLTRSSSSPVTKASTASSWMAASTSRRRAVSPCDARLGRHAGGLEGGDASVQHGEGVVEVGALGLRGAMGREHLGVLLRGALEGGAVDGHLGQLDGRAGQTREVGRRRRQDGGQRGGLRRGGRVLGLRRRDGGDQAAGQGESDEAASGAGASRTRWWVGVASAGGGRAPAERGGQAMRGCSVPRTGARGKPLACWRHVRPGIHLHGQRHRRRPTEPSRQAERPGPGHVPGHRGRRRGPQGRPRRAGGGALRGGPGVLRRPRLRQLPGHGRRSCRRGAGQGGPIARRRSATPAAASRTSGSRRHGSGRSSRCP